MLDFIVLGLIPGTDLQVTLLWLVVLFVLGVVLFSRLVRYFTNRLQTNTKQKTPRKSPSLIKLGLNGLSVIFKLGQKMFLRLSYKTLPR
jgi:hypothetical protein